MNKSFIFLLSLCVILTSCKIKKEIQPTFAPTPKSLKSLVEEVNAKSLNQPKWAFLKGTIKVEKPEGSVSLNIAIRSSKDSLIWTSISGPFGIEVFRIQITKDSIYFINRSAKQFKAQPLYELREYLGKDISFSEIQNIIMGSPTLIKQKNKLEIDTNNYILKSSNTEYVIDRKTFRIKEFKIIEQENVSTFSFFKFKEIDGYMFPLEWKLKSNRKEEFLLTIDYSKITFNEPQKISFKIPKKYVEINE